MKIKLSINIDINKKKPHEITFCCIHVDVLQKLFLHLGREFHKDTYRIMYSMKFTHVDELILCFKNEFEPFIISEKISNPDFECRIFCDNQQLKTELRIE